MNLQRAIIAHTDDFISERKLMTLTLKPDSWRLRLDYAEEFFDQGVNLAFDAFGHYCAYENAGFTGMQDWRWLVAVVALIRAGYSPQMVLTTDTYLKILLRRFGGEGYSRLTKFVVPLLRDVGVSEFDIRHMTMENPANLLAR